jgi:calcineurin-like phosphoesterase family protein
MNERLIANWNERVTPEDTVFHVGDFVFKSGPNCAKAEDWIKRLNGNIIFIRGNHDNNNSLKTILDCVHITYAGRRINLCHKPEHANPDFEINLVGHVHDKWRVRTYAEHYKNIASAVDVIKSDRIDWNNFLLNNVHKCNSESVLLNVGVDVQQYRPILLDEAISQVIRFQKGITK